MKMCFPPLALIFYTDALPEGVGGDARGPVIRIRSKYREDQGIHQHELEHVRQWWRTLGLHSVLYFVSRRYRLWAEAQAYQMQRWYPRSDGLYLSLNDVAIRLSQPRYKLGITVVQAVEYITGRRRPN